MQEALEKIAVLRREYPANIRIPSDTTNINMELEKAGRLTDFLELGDLLCRDALHRNESCGGHFREEYQTADNEALRNDAEFSYVAAWEYAGSGKEPILNKEPLVFEKVKQSTRSYK